MGLYNPLGSEYTASFLYAIGWGRGMYVHGVGIHTDEGSQNPLCARAYRYPLCTLRAGERAGPRGMAPRSVGGRQVARERALKYSRVREMGPEIRHPRTTWAFKTRPGRQWGWSAGTKTYKPARCDGANLHQSSGRCGHRPVKRPAFAAGRGWGRAESYTSNGKHDGFPPQRPPWN